VGASDGAGAAVRHAEDNLPAAFVGQGHAISNQFVEVIATGRGLELDVRALGGIEPLFKLMGCRGHCLKNSSLSGWRLSDQIMSEGEKFVDLSGREDAADATRMEQRKGSLDEVALFDRAAVDQKITQQAEELELAAVEGGMLGSELIDEARNRIGKLSSSSIPRMCRMKRRKGARWG